MSDYSLYEGPVTLAWDNEHPEGLDERVIADIRIEMSGLDKPQDIIFHTVPLTDEGFDGPIVHVYGKEGSAAFHCEYIECPTWVTADGVSLASRS